MAEDVLIVGAGPTGLAMALWLTELGVTCRIVDRTPGPGTTSRAMAVQARTLEFYSQLGFANQVVAAGHPNPTIHIWIERHKRARVSFTEAGKDITPYPYILIYPQDQHERLLIDQLERRGIEVDRNTELLRFSDKGDRVEAVLRLSTGEEIRTEARYLVGCDGASSIVRRAIGAGFPGDTASQFFYVADVELSGEAADGDLHVALDHADFMALESYGKIGQARLIGIMRDIEGKGPTEFTFEDVNHRVIEGLDLTIEKVNWFSTYRVHHRVTDRYRAGRVFLAGDAAHIHSPAGGQGMNTGIGDAINLSWKLAAVLQGKAPDSLLDSYQCERRAFAEQLVATTDQIFSFVTSPGNFANFVRTKIAPIVAPVAYGLGPVREFLFRLLSQTKISYRDSALSDGHAGKVRGGDRLPWVEMEDGDNFGVFRTLQWQLHVYGEASEALSRWSASHRVPLHVFKWNARCKRAGLSENAVYLVRPDMYVAFAGSGDVDGLEGFVKHRGLDVSSP